MLFSCFIIGCSSCATVQRHTTDYFSYTTNFFEIPHLGKLPLSSKEGRVSYDLSRYIPPSATEVLVYLFITARNVAGKLPKRGFYEIFTSSSRGQHYSQFMNVVFPTENDFVVNSANLWFPVNEDKRLFVQLPFEQDIASAAMSALASEQSYNNLAEAMEAFTLGEGDIFHDVYLLGFR